MKTTEIGKLFKVECDVDGFGFCGNDTPPTAGKPIVCSERYTLVLASEDDCDQDGYLKISEDLSHSQVEASYVDEEVGWSDSDGTARIRLVEKDGEWCFLDRFEIEV